MSSLPCFQEPSRPTRRKRWKWLLLIPAVVTATLTATAAFQGLFLTAVGAWLPNGAMFGKGLIWLADAAGLGAITIAIFVRARGPRGA